MRVWNLAAIRRANKASGHHWFSPRTMRFFKSRVFRTVYQGTGGVYFISWESQDGIDGAFSVRQFNPGTGGVRTHGEVMSFKSRRAASLAAKAAARRPDQAKVDSDPIQTDIGVSLESVTTPTRESACVIRSM
jgi:hypothetical protein